MKKIFALLLALCLLCLSASALAETVTEEKALELDGFSLILEPGEYYAVADEKVANQIYVQVAPYYGDGDNSTNYNAVWAGEPFEMTVDEMKAQAAEIESAIRSSFEAYGITVSSFAMSDPYEATISGVDCIVVEYTLDIDVYGQTMTAYEREIVVGSIGYTFTLSAASQELLEKVTQTLVDALVF